MVSSSGVLYNKKLIKIIKRDNYKDFIKHINKKKKNNDIIVNFVIKFRSKKILNKYLKIIDIKMKYFIYLININYKNECKEWYNTFFQLFLYYNLNNNEANIIINHLIKKKCWILLEYLHLYGFRIKDIQRLYDKLPINKIYRYISYGYDINENLFIQLIKRKKIDIFFLEYFSKYKYIFKNTVTLKNILLNISKFQTVEVFQYFLEYSDNISHLYLKKAFINSNYNLIKYLLSKKYYFNTISIKKLLTCNKLCIFKNKYFNKKIKTKKNFETNIIDILNILNNKLLKKDIILLKKILKKLVFFYLNNDFFDILLFMKYNLFINLKLSKYNINNYIIKNITKDNVNNIKKILDLNIINTQLLYCNKKYMDIALIYNSKKIITFFHNKLNIICSNNVLNNYKLFICNNKNKYVYKTRSNSLNYIKNLKLINYKLNIKLLNISSEFNELKSVKYLLSQNIKLNFKTFELALYNKNKKIIKYLNLKNCKYKSENMIDRYLNYHKKYYYSRINNNRDFKIIKDMYTKYNCTASYKCVKYIIYSLNYKLFRFINNKFNIIIDNQSLVKMVLLHSSVYGYMNTDRIDELSNIIIYSIDNCNIDTTQLVYILSNYMYMFSYKLLKKMDEYNIIVNNIIFNKAISINNIGAIDYYIEKGYIIDKDYLFYILFNNNNKKTYKYIINKIDYNIDILDINKIIINKKYSLNKIYYLICNLIEDFNIYINEEPLYLLIQNYNNIDYNNYYFINIFILLIKKIKYISNKLYLLIKNNNKLNKFTKYIKKNTINDIIKYKL